ncbi:class I SAM-dependent methyltransferase [Chlamydiota bacterium]
MNELGRKGVLGFDYASKREHALSCKYRLLRRTSEVLSSIKEFAQFPFENILDLGTADGRMLDAIYRKYPDAICVGVEYSKELVSIAKAQYPHLRIARADIQSLNFKDNSFDIIIAAAVFEHIPNPNHALKEVKRLLRSNGIFILTTPDPFWERIAVLIGHLAKDQHENVMSIDELSSMTKNSGLTVLQKRKFMISPIGLPFEIEFEKILNRLHLGLLMVNQLIIAQSKK